MSEARNWILRARARAQQITNQDSELRNLLIDGIEIMGEMNERLVVTQTIELLDHRLKRVEDGATLEERVRVLEQRKSPIVELESEVRRVLRDYGVVATQR